MIGAKDKSLENALERKRNAIHSSDCIQGMAKLPEGTIDLAFADPPFNIGYEYDVYQDRKEREDYLAWSEKWIAGVHRILKPNGTFWLAIGDEYAAELKLLSQKVGFHCRSWVIWYYTFGVNCTKKFSRSHAHLFYFVKDPNNFVFRDQDMANRIPSARQLVYADARANPKGRLPDDTWVKSPAGMVDGLTASEDSWYLRPQDIQGCFSGEEDTWYFPRVAGTFKERAGFHGCQMPEQLLGRIIRSCTEDNAESIVFDPFVGSATTLVVAKKLGRSYLGFELSEEYVRRGKERLLSVIPGDRLEGAAEPTVSAPATPKNADGKKKGKLSKQSSTSSPSDQSPLRFIEHHLKEAFREIHEGYSVDRVVVDPELNQNFAEACRSFDLPGDRRSWNYFLFGMRKAGKLSDIPCEQRTEIRWSDCDNYLFASEIAWKKLTDEWDLSLDEIFCEPTLANQFDELARTYSPGYSPFQYRWAALKLRKEAKDAKVASTAIKRALLSKPIELEKLDLAVIPQKPGVYLLSGKKGTARIYGGETFCLRERLKVQFSDAARENWKEWAKPQIQFFATETVANPFLAYQCRLVDEYRPILNYQKLANHPA